MPSRSLPDPSIAWRPALYECLHDLAARALRNESDARTWQPTALAHEAYLRLAHTVGADEGKAQFFALAGRVVRDVLVDHARRKKALKRGGDWVRVTLSDAASDSVSTTDTLDLLALDDALSRLETSHARAARVVELRFFSGLSIDETAAALRVSPSTIDVDWRFARAWLSRELKGSPAP